ncbi:hypothetical protein RZS08_61260, partial [Arthrospira platensis SPKY1]|nr:hypothetical protein [Arthrospira platensis SPKY1]
GVGAQKGIVGMFRGCGAAHSLGLAAGFKQMAAHSAGGSSDRNMHHDNFLDGFLKGFGTNPVAGSDGRRKGGGDFRGDRGNKKGLRRVT